MGSGARLILGFLFNVVGMGGRFLFYVLSVRRLGDSLNHRA